MYRILLVIRDRDVGDEAARGVIFYNFRQYQDPVQPIPVSLHVRVIRLLF